MLSDRQHNSNHWLLALAGTVLLTACGGGGGGSTPAQQGEKVFMRICATCHGKDANGMPNLGKGLHNNQFTLSKTDAELVQFLKTGRPAADPLNTTGVDMPPKGGDPSLTDQDLQNVVAYLRTL